MAGEHEADAERDRAVLKVYDLKLDLVKIGCAIGKIHRSPVKSVIRINRLRRTRIASATLPELVVVPLKLFVS